MTHREASDLREAYKMLSSWPKHCQDAYDVLDYHGYALLIIDSLLKEHDSKPRKNWS